MDVQISSNKQFAIEYANSLELAINTYNDHNEDVINHVDLTVIITLFNYKKTQPIISALYHMIENNEQYVYQIISLYNRNKCL